MVGLLGVWTGGERMPKVAVRTGRRLDQVDTDELLARMGSLRREIRRVRGQLGLGTIPETTLAALSAALDHTAHLIAGDDPRCDRAASAVLARRVS